MRFPRGEPRCKRESENACDCYDRSYYKPMAMDGTYDAVVVGSGPNGLCAAITLAQAGRKVLVRESQPTIGGSCRSAELTLPGFTHDICSTVQALASVSPMIKSLPLAQYGLELIEPPAAYADR